VTAGVRSELSATQAPFRDAECMSTESSDDTLPVESSEDQEGGLIATLGRQRAPVARGGGEREREREPHPTNRPLRGVDRWRRRIRARELCGIHASRL